MSVAVHVTPGKAYLVVHHGTGVALAPNPPAELADRLSGVVLAGGDADAILEALLADGLRAVADFVVFAVTDSATRLVVRGSALTARVGDHREGAGEDIIATGLWIDQTVSSAIGVLIRSGRTSAHAPRFKLQSGEATVSEVVVREHPSRVADGEVLTEPEHLPAVAPAAGLDSAHDASRLAELAIPDDSASTDLPQTPVANPGDDSYLRLFGDTTRLAPADVAESQAANDEPIRPSPGPSPLRAVPTGEELPSATVRDPMHTLIEAPEPFAASPAAGPVITGVPWLTSAPVSASGASSAPVRPLGETHGGLPMAPNERAPVESATGPSILLPGDLDLTVNRATLARHTASSVAAMVSAVRCPNGHLTQSHGVTCRVCRTPVSSQSAIEVPRPVLGRLRFDNGDEFALDRGYLFGRNPIPPDGSIGEQPNVVKLADQGRDISGQHLEVQVVGWNVYVMDLGSTNGTEVVLPGQPPRRLRERDALLIEAGTVVILAEVRRFTYEVV